jgi:ABC-type nitrate/sulfonate/bicarbonate transport system permease component
MAADEPRNGTIEPQAAEVTAAGGGASPNAAVPDRPIRVANERRRSRYLPLLSVFSLALVIFLWWLLTNGTHTIAPLKFPSISEAWDVVKELKGNLAKAAWATTWRVLVSWAIGCTLGVSFGLLLGRFRVAYYLANPIVEAIRPVPPIALIPFIILWFGLGETGRILLGALSCFMTMVVITYVAAYNVNPVYLRAARSLGAGENAVYRTVILRAIVPQLVGGIRICAALTWAVIVAAEYLTAQNGIGYILIQASRTLNTPVVLVGTIIVGLLAFLLERIIRLVSSRLTVWVEGNEG